MKPTPRRRRWIFAVKACVSLLLLAWLGSKMLERDGVEGLVERLGSLSTPWLAAAVGLHFLAVLAGVSRWDLLLRAASIRLPRAMLLRSFLIGRFVGAFTPSTTGLDGWRLWEVGRASGQMSRSAAVIVLEKLVGLIAMGSVCAALVPVGGVALLGPGALLAAALIAVGAGVGVVLMRHPRWLEALIGRAPKKVRGKLDKLPEALHATRLNRGQLAGALARGVVSHLSLSAVFVATALALGLETELGALLVVGNAITLAVLLPVSIGGVGVREGVAVALLATVGVGPTDAVLVALLGYLTGQVPALLGGLAMLGSETPERSAEPTPALVSAESTLS